MSISAKKILSREKELFLSIALLAGEVSSDTIRWMKRDYGESKIKNNVIQSLKKDGYIFKVGYKSNYGYQLSEAGLRYFKTKLPNKYDFDSFSRSNAYIYKEALRERARQLSMILYTLYKQDVSLENHMNEVSNIFNGYDVTVREPFFISSRQIRDLNVRFASLYGARIYGYVFCSTKILAVYAPDVNHNLSQTQEEAFSASVINMLKHACYPFCEVQNYQILYLFKSPMDIVDSFSMKDKINKRMPITRRVFEKFILKKSYIFFMDNNPYTLNEILYGNEGTAIDESFIEYFQLTEYKKKNIDDLYIDGLYYDYKNNRDVPTVICWTLSPSAIISAINFCRNKTEKTGKEILILCFEEQVSVLRNICDINKSIGSHIAIAELPSSDVHKLLRGEIRAIS